VRIELTKSHDGDRARFRRSRRPPIVSYPPTGARRAHVILTINPKQFCERGLLTHRTRPERVARPDTPRLSLSGGKRLPCDARLRPDPTLWSPSSMRLKLRREPRAELSRCEPSRASRDVPASPAEFNVQGGMKLQRLIVRPRDVRWRDEPFFATKNKAAKNPYNPL